MTALRIIGFLLSIVVSASSQARNEESCKYQGGHSIDITYGHGLKPTIMGKINGATVPMLVDTGAFSSFMTSRYIQKLGIPTKIADLKVEGVGGEQEVRAARIKELSIGPSKPTSGNFPVLGEYNTSTPYALILGADFLMQADLLVDLDQSYMQFFYPSNCKQSTVIFPDAIALDADWVSYDTRIFITLKINGVPMRTLIDTGATWSFIDQGAAKRAGITSSMRGAAAADPIAGVGGKEVAAWFVPVAKLEIGSEVFTDMKLEMADIAGDNYENRTEVILGTDFLQSFQVLFARSQKKVYLTKRKPLKLVGSYADWVAIAEGLAAKGFSAARSQLAELLYEGKGVARDDGRAEQLMREAASQGDHRALFHFAKEDFIAGDFVKAASSLRSLSVDPVASRWSDIMAFLASAHNGDKALATQELQSVRKQTKSKQWPMPIIDYLLGEDDEKDLMRSARKQPLSEKARECEARYFIGHLNWLRGDLAVARNSFNAAVAMCEVTQFEHRASTAALKQLGT